MNDNQETIQELMDAGDYAPMYPFISKSNLSDFQKILVSHMLNDIRMNDTITWKHETYANKMNCSRIAIWKQFKKLTEVGIIIPFEANKAGSKSNKFTVSFSKISSYKPVNQGNMSEDEHVNQENMLNNENLLTMGNKPVNDEQQPVNEGQQPVNDEQNPVNQGIHIKKSKETNKENNKEIIKDKPFDDSFFDELNLEERFNYKIKEEQEEPKKDISQDELEQFLEELNKI